MNLLSKYSNVNNYLQGIRITPHSTPRSYLFTLKPFTQTAFVSLTILLSLFGVAKSSVAATTTLSFTNTPTLVSGTNLSQGAVYRFANVAPGTDAMVQVATIQNAQLKVIDDNASFPGRFQPTIAPNSVSLTNSQSYVRFNVKLIPSSTPSGTSFALAPVLTATNVYFSAQDIDGNGGTNTIREFVEVIGALTSYVANPTLLQPMTNLPISGGVGYEQQNSLNVQTGIGTDDRYEFYSYLGSSVSSFSIVGGNITGSTGCTLNNTGCDRQNSWTFDVTDVQKLDWGDAPSSYGDAYHPVPLSPSVYLGTSVEGDDGPNYTASANGDDITGIDDEDGISSFPTLLTNSTSYSLNLTCAGTNTPVSGWIDFNRDGSFSNTTEKASGTCNGSTVTLNWTSLSGLSAGNVYARFRTASIASEVTNPIGQASNGEVEDYQLAIAQANDYGDAPNSFGDASHNIPTTPTIYLGSVKPDPELATQLGTDNGASAAGDDNNGTPDDEDAFTTLPNIPIVGNYNLTVPVTNTSGSAATLHAWIDFNKNGKFEAGEYRSAAVASGNTSANLSWIVPANAVIGSTHVRFRLTTNDNLTTDNPLTIDVDERSIGNATNGEVEDYPVSISTIYDYGDAPDTGIGTGTGNYQTTAIDGGAAQIKINTAGQVLSLGSNIDSDDGTLQDVNAQADDTNGTPDDEDGVSSFPTLTTTANQTYTVPVTVQNNVPAVNAYLVGYIDFNKDGDFNDTGEKSATVTIPSSSTNPRTFNVTFTTPAGMTTGNTYARFRLGQVQTTVESAIGASTSTDNGEVEDYQIAIAPLDYSDAPADGGTAPNGSGTTGYGNASHIIVSGTRLGANIDAETAAQNSANADGDDNNGTDDEDGITIPTLTRGQTATISANVAGTGGYLQGWIDWNGDGDFLDANEQIATNIQDNGTGDTNNTTGTISFSVNVPIGAIITANTFARFRWSTTSGLNTTNTASNGEVEDYRVTIIGLDYGDAPDAYGDASHTISASPNVYLGSIEPDSEVDTQLGTDAGASAAGDDSNGNDDEDGISDFPNLDNSDDSYSLTATVNNTSGSPANVYAWIDFDGDGEFDEDERATAANGSITLDGDGKVPTGSSGTITLNWANLDGTGANIVTGNTYVRIRLTTDDDLNATADTDTRDDASVGTASDGEVEDYPLTIQESNRALGSAFTCDSTFYITIGQGGSNPQFLYDVNRSGESYAFVERGQSTSETNGYPVTFRYNALAYNPVDNYLYGFIQGSGATIGPYASGNIVKIGSDGVLHSIGMAEDASGNFLPQTGYIAASILSDGTYIIGTGSNFAKIDLTTSPPTILSTGSISGANFTDFAVDPTDPTSLSGAKIYGINESGTSDRLVILNVASSNPTIVSQATNPTGFNHNAGSQFVDSFGTLYYRSNSTNSLYQVDSDPSSSTYGVATEVTTAPSGGNHDGASCLFASAMEKEVRDLDGNIITSSPAEETVNYVYSIASGNVDNLTGVTFEDDLRNVASGNPINGTFTGNVTVSNGTGTISFSNSNQTLQISDLTIPAQTKATTEADKLTITAEVKLPRSLAPGDYYNQAAISNLPSTYPTVIVSDYPPSAAYEDPTPLSITDPLDPNLILVKRITAINPGQENEVLFSTFVDDGTADNEDNNPNWPDGDDTYLPGVLSVNDVQPGDEVEYTIYFLSNGDEDTANVQICDVIPNNMSFVSNSFDNNSGIALLNSSAPGATATNLSNVADTDGGTFYAPNTALPTITIGDPPETKDLCQKVNSTGTAVGVNGGNNVNGAVIVEIGDIPRATAPGTPVNSYGFIRFRAEVQ